MGWFFMPGFSRQDLIRERTTSWFNDQLDAVCLEHAVRGHVLWTVWEHRFKDGRIGGRFIGCDLMQRSQGGWGYKAMEESMGPCYYTCPLSFLEMVHPVNEAWRAKVRAYHAEQAARCRLARTLTIGQTVTLRSRAVPEVTIVQVRPCLVGCAGGIRYRLRAGDLDVPAASSTAA